MNYKIYIEDSNGDVIPGTERDIILADQSLPEIDIDSISFSDYLSDDESLSSKKSDKSENNDPKILDLKNMIYCNICTENIKNISFRPCGHCVCSDCYNKLKYSYNYSNCPTCMTRIDSINKIHL